MLAEVLMRDVATAVAYQPPLLGEQPFRGETVERGQHQPLSQVASGAKEHEDRRTRMGTGVGRTLRSRHAPNLRGGRHEGGADRVAGQACPPPIRLPIPNVTAMAIPPS